MSFPVCDRCKADHNPYQACADLIKASQTTTGQERVSEVLRKFPEMVGHVERKDRKAYMRAYMAKRRATSKT